MHPIAFIDTFIVQFLIRYHHADFLSVLGAEQDLRLYLAAVLRIMRSCSRFARHDGCSSRLKLRLWLVFTKKNMPRGQSQLRISVLLCMLPSHIQLLYRWIIIPQSYNFIIYKILFYVRLHTSTTVRRLYCVRRWCRLKSSFLLHCWYVPTWITSNIIFSISYRIRNIPWYIYHIMKQLSRYRC